MTDDEVLAAFDEQIRRHSGPPGQREGVEPADLPGRLVAAGLAAEPAETLMVAEIADLDVAVPPPVGVELRPVVDERGIEAFARLHVEVFGGDHSAVGETLLASLSQELPAHLAVIAWSEGAAVGAGRVEFQPGTDFASIWGGGTLPEWRGRGVFRSVVAHRAALASARGFRYLQVDASPDSRPILRRLGFVELATTTPFVHPGR